MKRFVILTLLFSLIFTGSVLADSTNNRIVRVFVDGEEVQFPDQKPYIDRNERTLVPVRFPAEVFGSDVNWDSVNKEVIITHKFKKKNIVLTIGKKTYSVNGSNKTMDTEAVITNSRTMVPVRFVAEALDVVVDWEIVNEFGVVFAFTEGQSKSQQQAIKDKVKDDILKEQQPKPISELPKKPSEVEDQYGDIKQEIARAYEKAVIDSVRVTEEGVYATYPKAPEGYEWVGSVLVFYTPEYHVNATEFIPVGRNELDGSGEVLWQPRADFNKNAVKDMTLKIGLEKISDSGIRDWSIIDLKTGKVTERTARWD